MAWADIFKASPYNFNATTAVAMSCATFGLVMGGLIGGHVAHFLVKSLQAKTPGKEHNNDDHTALKRQPKSVSSRLLTLLNRSHSLPFVCLLAQF